LTFNPNTNPFT